MSAYMVDRSHIAFLLEAAMDASLSRCQGSPLRWIWNRDTQARTYESEDLYTGDHDKASTVGQMLWDENRKSIEARYPDTIANPENMPGPIGEDFTYGQHRAPVTYRHATPQEVISACDCYAYQACEHDGWRESQAFAFVEALKDRAVRALVGDAGEWGAPKWFDAAFEAMHARA